MKMVISESINRYRDLWKRMEGYNSALSQKSVGKGFFVRHHSFARVNDLKKYWYSEYTNEMYDSSFDCLACYRWYVIPERLREVSGLREETDLEILLDGSGYSASLIAEELFCMIDKCLESGYCSEKDLHRIRLAYNGLSGFQDAFICRIVQWGTNRGITYPEMQTAGVSFRSTNSLRNPFQEESCSGHIRRLSNSPSAAHVTGVFAG